MELPFFINKKRYSKILHLPSEECNVCDGKKCFLSGRNEILYNAVIVEINDDKFVKKCSILNGGKRFKHILKNISTPGYLCIYRFRGNKNKNLYSSILEIIDSSCKVYEFVCDKSISTFFPINYPFAFYYYYSFYYPKSLVIRSVVYFMIKCELHNLLYQYLMPVSVIIISKNN